MLKYTCFSIKRTLWTYKSVNYIMHGFTPDHKQMLKFFPERSSVWNYSLFKSDEFLFHKSFILNIYLLVQPGTSIWETYINSLYESYFVSLSIKIEVGILTYFSFWPNAEMWILHKWNADDMIALFVLTKFQRHLLFHRLGTRTQKIFLFSKIFFA